MIRVITLSLTLYFYSNLCEATILACSDRIEKVQQKKEKEGLGDLGKSICKNSQEGKKARYKKNSPWMCKTVDDYPCVDNKKLRMVQCDREWECY